MGRATAKEIIAAGPSSVWWCRPLNVKRWRTGGPGGAVRCGAVRCGTVDRVTASPRHRVTASPRHRVTAWGRISRFHEGPSDEQLFAVMTPIAPQGTTFGDDLDTPANGALPPFRRPDRRNEVRTMDYPSWVRADRVLLRAEWDGRPRTTSDLARSWGRLTDASNEALGGDEAWQVDGYGPLTGADDLLLEQLLVARVERGDDGSEWASHGCNIVSNRSGINRFVSLSLQVGSTIRGRRKPSNSVTATVVGPTIDGEPRSASVQLVEAVLTGIVRAWDPESAGAYDRRAARAVSDAGRFAPVMGQRTWVSARLGAIETMTSGVSLRISDHGSYLSADDELDSALAVQEIRATLEANGVVEIPRAD